ncbi:MAG: TlpA family protein disulfide reductase [Sphingomonas sp.]|uniref:TlpA family protein disulfide reductase n=1 Tax=Sphingomonas sp. TaxID=28214 RepID=UPI003F80DDF9
MRAISRLVRGVAIAAALAAGTAAPLGAHGEKVTVGQPAPDFTLTLIDGTKITRDQLRGQVVILNYWATWCGPCRQELPLLDTYYEIQKKHGLRVFAVATEDSVSPFFMKKLFAVMHIQPTRKIKGPYDLIGNALPTNIIIGRDGRVRYAQAGAFTLDTLNQVLVPLLNEPAPSSPAASPTT